MQILADHRNDSLASERRLSADVPGISADVRGLSDNALLASARNLVGRERRVTADLVAHLAEIETRALFQREGYSSLFVYFRDALGLSEHEAYGRIEAARAARKFPLVLDLLREGSINFTSVGLLARHLTPENHRGVLESARGKKKIEVEEIVAGLHPIADVPASLRKLPAAPPAPALAVEAVATTTAPAQEPVGRVAAASTAPASTAALRQPIPAATPPPLPLAPDRYKYQLTIDRETRDLLSFAKDMLRHAEPGGDDATLLKRALELLVADLARKKFGACEGRAAASRAGRAQETPVAPGSRHIPARVKRIVFVRDRGLRVRRSPGSTLRRTWPPGIPSCQALCGGRGGQH